ncbi:glycosyltransferase family 4 protein [Geitlerinema sp. PCC 9228]|jgi:glycosyltransferase involved in cell wall biosynthesis|uniref:glycosyltransferase family 4 protein n=1 Tax=Geitlerinema sp. PCC 9228 TaxID=111611 RepID=UPI0008F99C5C|nr:glycosyltransferase family 4 protein [Geitlerinema sp. PCC 9228]
MKTLILSTSDIEGGAARAAYRLHQGLLAVGEGSQMLVRAKYSSDRHVLAEKSVLTKLGPPASRWPLRRYPQREKTLFSAQWFPDAIAAQVARLNPDIVNLHWVCSGYVRIETLAKLQKPVVWTLQDMWAFTGGCHYSQNCDRYQQQCGSCPQLKSHKERDLSRKIWKRKQKAWKHVNLTVVTPSRWMAECVQASSLLGDRRIAVIPFCLSTQTYRPIDTNVARNLLGLPQDKHLVLFGAISATADPRKGFHLLIPALQKLSQWESQENVELVVFGASPPEKPLDVGFKVHYLGNFSDDLSLALVYSAADVMVVPSLQESFGQTASEALACGTPVVAFDTTGLRDIVDSQQNGYLAKPYETEDLARGIAWILQDRDRYQQLRTNAREKAERAFALEIQAKRYLSLFQELLEK